jgi:hypothetical protein
MGSLSKNRYFDTWRRLDLIEWFWVLPSIVDGKTVVFTRGFIGYTGFVQDAIDPRPNALRKSGTAKIADTTGTNCTAEHIQ